MSRHDAMRKIYEADPGVYDWRFHMPGVDWGTWVTTPEMRPSWHEKVEYEIRRRDGKPLFVPSRHAEMRTRYDANPAGYRWRVRFDDGDWAPWNDYRMAPLWREQRDYEIEPIDPPSHRDGMPNALHPPRPEDVFDPEKSPDHAPRWLVIGGGPQEYYSRESALQTAEEWSRSDPGRTYLIAKVEAICETQPPVFSVREL